MKIQVYLNGKDRVPKLVDVEAIEKRPRSYLVRLDTGKVIVRKNRFVAEKWTGGITNHPQVLSGQELETYLSETNA